MKKMMLAALTGAIVMGTAGTTFAASNPFSDVPAGHWAYDAVAQLAQDGVIDGYGDNTFQGDKNITRYEMAQMVAKAIAKMNTSAVKGADKALVDKLAAEFSDELNNLGVRVARLEKNADKVQWHGMARYDAGSVRYDLAPVDIYPNGTKTSSKGAKDTKDNYYATTFRLEPKAEVNDHWNVKARLDAYGALNTDTQGTVGLKRLWAEGVYGNSMFRFGRMPVTIDMDIMFDTQFSGAQAQFGNKVKATINAGRFNLNGSGNQYYKYAHGLAGAKADSSADYAAIGFTGWLGKLNAGTAYHYLKSNDFGFLPGYKNGSTNEDQMQTWTAKGTYHFDKNIALQGNYGQNFKADAYDKSGSIVLGYKDFENFDTKNKGQWGMALAYRHVGQNVGPTPTYTLDAGTKGWELSYLGNIMSHTYIWLKGVTGKTLMNDKDYKELFGRIEWQF